MKNKIKYYIYKVWMIGDINSAYYVKAKNIDEAFKLARKQNKKYNCAQIVEDCKDE